ncbi:MAG: hypothetical protein IT162_06455 [Bryobacterales bacterium]|nr:hypothetical protein [Bryobacterales bacterium]
MTPLAAPLLVFAASVLAALAFSNHLLSRAQLPSYATWTGVATLERKLELYREFAAAGPVDLLLYGDSCTDHGVSAELLTQELSRVHARPYRVFNFSTGAGGNRTFPLVYRLLRTVARPRRIAYLYTGGRSEGVEDHPLKPEYILQRAPAGRAIPHELWLPADAWFWRQPLLRQATAARDGFFHFGLANWPQTHVDVYAMNRHGDTVSYLFEHDFERLEQERRVRARIFDGVAAQCPEPGSAACVERVLGGIDRAKLQEVAALAADDGAGLVLLRHDSALGYLVREPEYRAGLETLWAAVRASLGNVPLLGHPDFVPRPYEIADAMHLNRIGAGRLTRRFAALLAAQPPPDDPPELAYCAFNRRTQETFGPYAGMVVKPAGSWTTLHLRLHTHPRGQHIDWRNPPPVVLERADGEALTATPERDGADDDACKLRFPGLPARAEAQIVRLPGYNIPLRAAWWTE